jgi:hypothetical protein
MRSCVVVRHDPGYTVINEAIIRSSPEEAKEKSKSVIAPASAVDCFDKDRMGVVLVLLNNGQGNDESKCGPNIQEGVILLSVIFGGEVVHR